MNLEVKTRRVGPETAVVALVGEADVFTVPPAKAAMMALLGEGVKHLIVDLSGTEYLDSTALGALVGILRRVRAEGGSVQLVNPPPHVRRLFEITRLDQVFPIHDGEAAALAAIEQGTTGAGHEGSHDV